MKDAAEWQDISTAPERKNIDIWIKSVKNENYGIRSCDVSFENGPWGIVWIGNRTPEKEFGEYAAYWMPLPPPPPQD